MTGQVSDTQHFVRETPRGGAMYMGEPDGPMRFIKSMGMEVPTFIDPRNDLKSQYRSAASHKAVDYHVPISCRGVYRPEQLADYDPQAHYPTTRTGVVRCGGLRPDGQICQKSARNLTGFCSNHGGALHPADKIFISERGIMPSHPEKLSRLQKVEMGIIPVNELTDEEIAKQQIKNNDGTFDKHSPLVSAKIASAMRAEFFARADQFVRENVMDMLAEARKIAMSKVAEDKDKLAAIQWLTERALGKTPDVLITNKTDAPFEQLIGDVVSGSRAESRANRGQLPAAPIEGEFSAITVIDDDEEDEYSGNETEVSVHEAALPDLGSEVVLANDDPDEADIEVFAPGEGYVPLSVQEGSESVPEGDESQGSGTESNSRDDGSTDEQLTPVQIAAERRAAKERIKKARNRRYAAKSRGIDTIDDLPYEVVFKESETARYGKIIRMKLVAPEDQKSPRMR